MLGTPLAIQTGCCGAIAAGIAAGDLFAATEAFCGEGASQYYGPGGKIVAASLNLGEWRVAERLKEVELLTCRIYTTSALFSEGEEEVEAWFQAGYSAVDMETAATFAVARYFTMARASILFAFDNPRQRGHILLDDAQKDKRRAVGNHCMIELVLEVVKEYGSKKYG